MCNYIELYCSIKKLGYRCEKYLINRLVSTRPKEADPSWPGLTVWWSTGIKQASSIDEHNKLRLAHLKTQLKIVKP